LEVGKDYALHFTNNGTLTHEVLIGSQPIVIEGGFHHDFTDSLLQDVEVEITGEMNDAEFAIGVTGLIEFEMAPLQELQIQFTLPETAIGEWELGCFVSLNPDTATEENPGAGHYDAGMHLIVNVVAASES
jgi:hypothetical protein